MCDRSQNAIVVYALIKKNSSEHLFDRIFYIGQTNNPRLRKNLHKICNRNPIKTNIINKYDFELIVLYDKLSPKEADDREIFLIRYFGKKIDASGQLANIEDGGNRNKDIGIEIRHKMRNKKLTLSYDEILEHLSKFQISGLTKTDYARQNNLSIKNFSNWTIKYGDFPKRYNAVLTTEEKDEIVKLSKCGKNIADIQRITKRSRSTVKKIIKEIECRI